MAIDLTQLSGYADLPVGSYKVNVRAKNNSSSPAVTGCYTISNYSDYAKVNSDEVWWTKYRWECSGIVNSDYAVKSSSTLSGTVSSGKSFSITVEYDTNYVTINPFTNVGTITRNIISNALSNSVEETITVTMPNVSTTEQTAYCNLSIRPTYVAGLSETQSSSNIIFPWYELSGVYFLQNGNTLSLFPGSPSVPSGYLIMPDCITTISDDTFRNQEFLRGYVFGANSVLSSIGRNAFYNNSQLEFFVIPNGVTAIEPTTFKQCSSMTTVTIGSSVAQINSEAFYNCQSLTSITIPNSVSVIKSSAFRYCSSMHSVSFGGGITLIEDYAFANCGISGSLSFAGIQQNFSIWEYAFAYCTSLNSVTIPANAIMYAAQLSSDCTAQWAFYNCTNLSSINYYSEYIPTRCFSGCSNLSTVRTYSGSRAIHKYAFYSSGSNNGMSVTFASTVETIGQYAFKESKISSVNLENSTSLSSIGEYCFENCDKLTSVKIPRMDGLGIGNYSFQNCTALSSVVLQGYTIVGSYSFYNCIALSSLTINGDVKIYSYAFCNCGTGLASGSYTTVTHVVSLPAVTTTIIYSHAFDSSRIYSAANASVFPLTNISSIGDYAFYDCKYLYSVCLDNESRLGSIGQSAFDGCTNVYSLKLPTNSSYTTVSMNSFIGISAHCLAFSIPSNITVLEQGCFATKEGTTAVTSTIVFDAIQNIESIGAFAFNSYGTALASVVVNQDQKFKVNGRNITLKKDTFILYRSDNANYIKNNQSYEWTKVT